MDAKFMAGFTFCEPMTHVQSNDKIDEHMTTTHSSLNDKASRRLPSQFSVGAWAHPNTLLVLVHLRVYPLGPHVLLRGQMGLWGL